MTNATPSAVRYPHALAALLAAVTLTACTSAVAGTAATVPGWQPPSSSSPAPTTGSGSSGSATSTTTSSTSESRTTTSRSTSSTASSASSATSSTSSGGGSFIPADVAGSWTGTYTCNQGLTALTLTLAPAGDTAVTGSFEFSADPSNPGVPSGAYDLSGTITGTDLVLTPGAWTTPQPGGYSAVGLTVALTGSPPLTTLTGTVDATNCTTFEVTRS